MWYHCARFLCTVLASKYSPKNCQTHINTCQQMQKPLLVNNSPLLPVSIHPLKTAQRRCFCPGCFNEQRPQIQKRIPPSSLVCQKANQAPSPWEQHQLGKGAGGGQAREREPAVFWVHSWEEGGCSTPRQPHFPRHPPWEELSPFQTPQKICHFIFSRSCEIPLQQ